MVTDVIQSSVLPDIANAGMTAGRVVGEAGGWLRNQFNQTSPDAQKWMLAAVGLFGGAVLGNIAANMSGQQGGWGGTAIKWGMALTAMTFLSSDQGRNMLSSWLGIGGDPAREAATTPTTTATVDTNPRNPWRDGEFTPTREMRPALPTPGS